MKKSLFFAFAVLAVVCSCHGERPDSSGTPEGQQATPLPVSVNTAAATVTGTDKATLHGSVLVSGVEIPKVTVSFLYSATAGTVEELVASGESVEGTMGEDGAVQAAVEGLQWKVRYHYVAVARVEGNLFYGEVKSFWTELAPEAVDLGLSVKWASWNLGATAPGECGDYYAWGETEPKEDYSWDTYVWGSDCDALIKYCPLDGMEYWAGEGAPDGKTALDPGDDAAAVRLGGSWRMPTDEEWTELLDNCTWLWTGDDKGYKVTSKKPGFTDRWVFFPAAGYREGTSLSSVGANGNYWSSSLNVDYPDDAWYMYFYSGSVFLDFDYRCKGHSIRPVMK